MVVGVTTALLLLSRTASAASFVDPATAAVSVTAAVLAPPTGLGLANGCQGGLLGLLGNNPTISATWTRSAQISGSSSGLRGHAVRVVVAGTTYDAVTAASVTASSTTATVIGKTPLGGGAATALPKGVSHQVLVRSTWGSWESTSASATITTLSGLSCL